MYSAITNPNTGRRVSTTGVLGKSIIKNYLLVLRGGSAQRRFGEAPPGLRYRDTLRRQEKAAAVAEERLERGEGVDPAVATSRARADGQHEWVATGTLVDGGGGRGPGEVAPFDAHMQGVRRGRFNHKRLAALEDAFKLGQRLDKGPRVFARKTAQPRARQAAPRIPPAKPGDERVPKTRAQLAATRSRPALRGTQELDLQPFADPMDIEAPILPPSYTATELTTAEKLAQKLGFADGQ